MYFKKYFFQKKKKKRKNDKVFLQTGLEELSQIRSKKITCVIWACEMHMGNSKDQVGINN